MDPIDTANEAHADIDDDERPLVEHPIVLGFLALGAVLAAAWILNLMPAWASSITGGM